MSKYEVGRVIRDIKDLNVCKTSDKGTFAIAFSVEGESFAIAIEERMGAKLMIQLVAMLGTKTRGKAKVAKTAPDKATAIVAEDMKLIPREEGGAVLILEMDGIDIPISLAVEQCEQLAQAFEARKPVGLDVDEMQARAPNALETDNRFYLQMASDGNKIEWKFGREKAEQLHRTLGAWLSSFPPSKPH